MKKILCIILSLVLIVTCLAGFITRTELKENVPLTPIPGVKSSDDYNEDVAYPPVAPSDIAIQRWVMPGVKYNSSEEKMNYIYNELGITDEVFQKELLSVEKKYYVNRFYGAGYWYQYFSDYNPNVVITSQEQLDCFFAWYCSPQSSSWSEEQLEKALDYTNDDLFAENIYRTLSAVDYSESTVIILTLRNRVDGLILHGNAVLGLVDKNIDSRLDGGQFEYTYFYVINNDNLPEDRENLVIVKAQYEEVVLTEMYLTDYGWGMKKETYENAPRELRFSSSWCSVPQDFFRFVKVDESTEIQPIRPRDFRNNTLEHWLESINYECEFTPYKVIEEAKRKEYWLEVDPVKVPVKDLENTIRYDALVSGEDAQKYPVLASGSSYAWYVATQKEEALSLVANHDGNVVNSDAYALYQKIKDIDFSEKALVFVTAEVDVYNTHLESLAVSGNNLVVTLKQQEMPNPPTWLMAEWVVEPGTVRFDLRNSYQYVLVVDKIDLPNGGENVEVLVLTKDAEDVAVAEAEERGYYLATQFWANLSFEERTEDSFSWLYNIPLYNEWLERNKK